MISETLSTTASAVTFKQPISSSIPAKVKKTESNTTKDADFKRFEF